MMIPRRSSSSCPPSTWSENPKGTTRPALERCLFLTLRFLLLVEVLYILVSISLGCASSAPLKCRPSADVDLARLMEVRRLDGTVEAVWMRCERKF